MICLLLYVWILSDGKLEFIVLWGFTNAGAFGEERGSMRGDEEGVGAMIEGGGGGGGLMELACVGFSLFVGFYKRGFYGEVKLEVGL